MMTTKTTTHTPGPWRIYKRTDRADIQIEHTKSGNTDASPFNQGICDMSEFECRARPEEAMANARLIAAAPELLVLLKRGQVVREHMLAALKAGTGLVSGEWVKLDRDARDLLATIDGKDG